MKKSIYLFLVLLALNACIYQEISSTPVAKISSKNSTDNVSNNVLHINYDAKIGNQYILDAVKKYSATVIRTTPTTVSVQLPKGNNVDHAANHFKKVKGVQSIDWEKVYRIH
ncbi:MAG: hypothetical protein IK065_04475 [Neisseriaceae bacterium]|nr:hypothetical protein [Neisseriaceae bacterium]